MTGQKGREMGTYFPLLSLGRLRSMQQGVGRGRGVHKLGATWVRTVLSTEDELASEIQEEDSARSAQQGTSLVL